MGSYEEVSCDDDSVRLWHFIEALTWAAASALTGIRLRDLTISRLPWMVQLSTPGFVIVKSDGVFGEGRIDVRYVSDHTSTKRLQQVIKARIMTPTVAAMLARVEEDVWHEQA